jgi:hypothetical protein
MTNLHNGQLDQASRAAAAILAVHRGYSPKQIGSSLNAVLKVDLDFSATSRQRWERYSAACLDNGKAMTNRRWAEYPETIQHAAYALADRAEEVCHQSVGNSGVDLTQEY